MAIAYDENASIITTRPVSIELPIDTPLPNESDAPGCRAYHRCTGHGQFTLHVARHQSEHRPHGSK